MRWFEGGAVHVRTRELQRGRHEQRNVPDRLGPVGVFLLVDGGARLAGFAPYAEGMPTFGYAASSRAVDRTGATPVHNHDADSANRGAGLHFGDRLSGRGCGHAPTSARRMVPVSGRAWRHVMAGTVSARCALARAHSVPHMMRPQLALSRRAPTF